MLPGVKITTVTFDRPDPSRGLAEEIEEVVCILAPSRASELELPAFFCNLVKVLVCTFILFEPEVSVSVEGQFRRWQTWCQSSFQRLRSTLCEVSPQPFKG